MQYTDKQVEEMLKQLMPDANIDTDTIQHEMEMLTRKKILESYPYKIWRGNDGRWRTHLPDRKLIARSSKEKIEIAIIDYYDEEKAKEREKEKVLFTFDAIYKKWRSVHDIMLSDDSIRKYDTDYLRFFKDKAFAQMDIREINEEDIKTFIIRTIKDQKLCKSAAKTLLEHTVNTIKYARMQHMITENPAEFLSPKMFYRYCTEIYKPEDRVIIPDDQYSALFAQLDKDYIKRPKIITYYGVEMAVFTEMRVSEIAALRWDHIYDDYILIDQSEKHNRKTKEYTIEGTKTNKIRKYPMTPEIRDLLDRIKKAEMKQGYLCEWVFADAKGRIHAPAISACCKNKWTQLGITTKGIHAFRRTGNSKIRQRGASAEEAGAIIGNSGQVNDQYYTFDVTSMEEKAKIVSSVNASTARLRHS